MKLLYCARCTTPLMSAATVFVCPCCGAAYRQRGTRFSFVADLSGVSVKELMQSMEVTLGATMTVERERELFGKKVKTDERAGTHN